MNTPTTRPKTVEELDHLEVFYLCFGLMRQSIWKVEPRMKRVMLKLHK